MAPALGPGVRVGPYELIEVVGAGGMGVVFRARDAKLLRTVAIKVLPNDRLSATGGEQLLSEARAVSALNHPGVCTIHEVREEQGQVLLVMEYVEGRPLNQQIPDGGLPSDSVVRYGIQIADALAHAHDRGILHRDLKSANVIVTKDGRPKIVDFGLASRFVAVEAKQTARSTESLARTDPLAGTLGYMAPEVLEGAQPTVASDLWGLGILLYEMAAGRLPFGGRTPFELTAAIIRAPAPALPLHVPASLRMIITRSLIKEPEQRYQSAREVRAALEAVQSDALIVPVPPVRAPAQRMIRWSAYVATILVALAGIALMWRARSEPSSVSNVQRSLHQVLASDRQRYDPALSSDGTMIVYVAQDETGRFDLFVGRVSGGRQLRITNDDARETHPRFSPDGEQIVFARRRAGAAHSEICLVPALGGEISAVISDAGQPVWSPDASRLAYIRAGPGSLLTLVTSKTDGSTSLELARSDGAYPYVSSPAWSPDGRDIAFVRGTGGASGEIWIMPASGGSPKRVTIDSPNVFSDEPVFTADGRSIVHSSNRGGATNIWAVPREGGPAVRLTTGSGPDESPTVDRIGRVAFLNSRWRNELSVSAVDGRQNRVLVRHTPFLWGPAFSPDDRTIAFSQSEVDGAWHLWLIDVDGGTPRRLTSGDLGEIYPRWSPNGRFVLYHTWGGPRRVWRVPREGGRPSPVSPPDIDATYADVSPDELSLAFVVAEGKSERIYVMPLSESAPKRLLRSAAASLPHWSPNGQLIAFAADRGYFGGIFTVHPDGTGERQITSTGGWPIWWPDGRRIAYTVITGFGTQEIRTVAIDGSSAEVSLPIHFEGTNFPFDIAHNSRSLASTNAVHISSEVWMLGSR